MIDPSLPQRKRASESFDDDTANDTRPCACCNAEASAGECQTRPTHFALQHVIAILRG
jgi:hypothetical protein